MSHRDSPPLTPLQVELIAFYRARLEPRGVTAGWGQAADGNFLSQYAQDAHAAWIAAVRSVAVERELLVALATKSEGRANTAMAWLRECVEYMDQDENITKGARKFIDSSSVRVVDNDDQQSTGE